MKPVAERLIDYYNETDTLEVRVTSVKEEDGEEIFAFKVTKIKKEERAGKYQIGQVIYDSRRIGSEVTKSGMYLGLDQI